MRWPFLLGVAAFLHCVSARGKTQTVLRIDHFGNCENIKGIAAYYNDSGVEPWGKTSAGYGTLIVQHNLKEFSKATATIRRCKDAADQTCELFQTWRFTSNICGMLLMKNVIWTPLFTYTPPLRCPVHKGVYKIRHATFDVRQLAMIKFPTDGYWRVKIEVEDDTPTRIYCIALACKFMTVRA